MDVFYSKWDLTICSESILEYSERFSKFQDYLKSRAGNSSTFPTIQARAEWRAGMSTSGQDAFKRVRQQVVKIPLHANDTMTQYVSRRFDGALNAHKTIPGIM